MMIYGTIIEPGQGDFFLVDFANIVRPEVLAQVKSLKSALEEAAEVIRDCVDFDEERNLSVIYLNKSKFLKTVVSLELNNLDVLDEEE